MLRAYNDKTRRTLEALARVYAADRFTLTDEELAQLTAHSEAYFRTLPLRFRFAVALVLSLFRLSSWWVAPRRRFLAKSIPDQTEVYERWFAGHGYLSLLLGQVLHLSFLGSFYSLPKVQSAIGYQRVLSVK